MRKNILLVLFTLLLYNGFAQIINQPAINTPKIILPTTFAGKVQFTDSLKARNLSAAQILKIYLPQYQASFQQEMIDVIRTMYDAGFSAQELASSIKVNYPGVTLAIASKIMYAALNNTGFMSRYVGWPWLLQDSISMAYGPNASKNTIVLLKQAVVPVDVIYGYFFNILIVGFTQNRALHFEDIPLEALLSNFIKAGFTVSQMYTVQGDYIQYPSILRSYCNGMKMGGVTAIDLATLLKQKAFTNQQITDRLKEAGYSAAEVMAALQSL